MYYPNVDLLYISVGIVLYLLCIQVFEKDFGVIVTSTGPVKGRQVNDDGINVYVYEGIPYAEKPIGSLRFKPPVAITPWNETLLTNQSSVCMQSTKHYSNHEMSEDCLYLNIYIPYNQTQENPKPVYVFLNSESWPQGVGEKPSFGPQYYLKENIMFISINYRLGPFGFLSLDNEDAPGNAGLKDIQLALKWIKENVDKFGGDNTRITLGGTGFGAAMIQYLMLTEKSEGLFHNAVIISGSILSYKSSSKGSKDTKLLAEELHIDSSDEIVILRKLKEIDAFDVIKAYDKLKINDKNHALRWPDLFQPVIEKDSDHAIVTKVSIDIIKSGMKSNGNILIGFSNQEANIYLPINNKYVKYINSNMELLIPSNIEYPIGSKNSKTLAKLILKTYFEDKSLTQYNSKNLTNLLTDTQFIYPTNKWIKLLNMIKGKGIFYYNFAFDGDLNFSKKSKGVQFEGAAHGDINGYIFTSPTKAALIETANEQSKKMQITMSKMFANFIRFGNPTPPGHSDVINWTDYGKNGDTLFISDKIEENNQFDERLSQRLEFWDEIYHEYENYVLNSN